MRGGGHDVGADQRLLHHRLAVQLPVVAARAAPPRRDGAVGRREQRARPARQVGDAQRLHRLRVAPVHVQPRDGEFGEQRGGGGPRVEGRQELAVGDQPPEHLPREVLRRGDAEPRELVGGGAQICSIRFPASASGMHVRRSRATSKIEPVVDREDALPRGQRLLLADRAASREFGSARARTRARSRRRRAR